MKNRKCTASFKGKDGFGTCDSKCQWYRKGRNCVCSKMTKTTREAKGSYFKFIAEGNKVFPDNMYGKIKTTFGKIKYE